MDMQRFTDDDRFSRIMVTDTCWLWMGGTYGRYGSAGKIPGTRTTLAAHRWSYEFWHGPIPAGMNVLHRCDTPLCVSPDHLFLGDHAANMADMKAKGRARTDQSYKRQFTDDQIRAIRSDGRSLSSIAADYGCSKQTVWQVKAGRIYRDVS